MASYYVYSGAVGAGTGASWANAYTTLTAATTSGKSNGDIFYVAHDHSESTAAAITVGASPTLNAQILCVNRAGSVPPVAADLTTGALVLTTGNSNIQINGRHYYEGLTFEAGNGASGTASVAVGGGSSSQVYKNCAFKLGSTGTSSRISIGASGTTTWINCTVQFGATAQFITNNAGVYWSDTPSAITGATIPNAGLIDLGNNACYIEGVDLSAIASGTAIFRNHTGGTVGTAVLKDCKIASGALMKVSATNAWGGLPIEVIRTDSSGANYRHERYDSVGTQTTETTIVRTGGASDGVTPIAWKLVTGSNCQFIMPMRTTPISVWNEDTGGTKTITVEGIWGGGAVPDNDDIWIEVEYLGDSGSPKGSFVSSAKATVLTTAASYASSSETWGGSTTKFKMSATTGTIQLKGPITVRVFAGLASSTFYICPKLTVA